MIRITTILASLVVGCSSAGQTPPDAETGVDVPGGDDIAAIDDCLVEVPGVPVYRMVDLVNPLVAVGGMAYRVSNNFPGASAPFGMVQPSPDTCSDKGGGIPLYHCGGYHDEDGHICGFSSNHLAGVGAPDLGLVSFMPSLGPVDEAKIGITGYLAPFDHATEVAHPGYYSVVLSNSGIGVELTATRRVAHHRYTFPESGGDALVVFDLGHTIQGGTVLGADLAIGTDKSSFSGSVSNTNGFADGITVYYYTRFNTPWSTASLWKDGQFLDGSVAVLGPNAGGAFSFPAGDTVEMQVALSYVSVDNARGNLEAETPDWDFDGVREQTEMAWEEMLGRIRFAGGSKKQRVLMATALYHAFLMPNLFMDTSGEYRGFDLETHTAEGFEYYTNLSMWDTYRTVHPLYLLVARERQHDMVRSLLTMADQGGYLPRWPMGYGYDNGTVGTPADIIIAESYLKGITDFDAQRALQAMLSTADGPVPPGHPFSGRKGIESYLDLGYVSTSAASRNVARSLEFYIADFAIAGLAGALGETETAQRFLARSQDYGKLWDPEIRCFRGRTETGEFEAPIDPVHYEAKNYYYGGNCLHYAWLVPHDLPGYLGLWEGPDALTEALDEFLELGRQEAESDNPVFQLAPPPHYNHGNQPDIHAAYLFLASGRPDLTQEWVHWISDHFYSEDHDGLPGNDDGGTLSSWYVFSSLGIYPVPGADYYLVGRPLFPLVEIAMEDHVLTIEAPGAEEGYIYVQSVTLDDVPVEHPVIRHTDLAAASVLRFEMGPAPSTWGNGGLPDWTKIDDSRDR